MLRRRISGTEPPIFNQTTYIARGAVSAARTITSLEPRFRVLVASFAPFFLPVVSLRRARTSIRGIPQLPVVGCLLH